MWKLLQSLSGLGTFFTGSRHLLWAALQPVSTFCCLVLQRPACQQTPVLGSPHRDHILCKQVQDWPSAQTGLNNPNTCPKGCASLRVSLSSPCLSTAHWHTAVKPRNCGFYVFFFSISASLSGSCGSMLRTLCHATAPARPLFSSSPL